MGLGYVNSLLEFGIYIIRWIYTEIILAENVMNLAVENMIWSCFHLDPKRSSEYKNPIAHKIFI